jgi:Xaa-Pro dipeptidase
MAASDLSRILSARHEALRSALREAALDALVVNPGPTLGYLTGLHFHLSERPVLAFFPVDGAPVMVVPELESQKTDAAAFGLTVHTYPERPDLWQAAFSAGVAAAGLGSSRLGVEPRWLRYLELGFLRSAAPGSRLGSAEDTVAALRMHKDDAEIAAMQKATEIAQDALTSTLGEMAEGITERETAAVLIQHLLRYGSEGELPFQPIIAFGPNSANPHAVPTGRALQPGDLVLFDWGANSDGYFSDLTRTFTFGDMDPELLVIADLVEAANAAGREASGPGVSAGAVDRAARAVIEAGGYGPRFIHRTGHGLGLEVHEDPYIRGDNELVLAPGMTFTVEPGIYLTGRGGVRIEDDVLITPDGARSLSDLPRAVVPLPIG